MIILFRCDASPALGGGHAMRCLALADAFAGSGAICVFAVNAGATNIVPGLVRHRVIEVDGEPTREAGALAETFPEGVDLLVVDHYHRDAAFETACRSFAREILVIDDLADRVHDCDWLVDPTLGRRTEAYAGLVPQTCQLLLGPDYALLRPEFAALRPHALARRERCQSVERILISFGASDPHDLCGTLLGPLLDALPDVSFDVVTGGPPSPATHEAAERGGGRVRLIRQTADMAYLMAEADFAIGACGGTSWERCALGLPAAVVITADNQREIAAALVEAGAVLLAKPRNENIADDFIYRLSICLQNQKLLSEMYHSASKVCDGSGCQRVLSALLFPKGKAPSWWRRPRIIDVVCDNDSWILPYILNFVDDLNKYGENAKLVRNHEDVRSGGIAFYLGCIKITPSSIRDRHFRNLVVHESDLPYGRGFAPLFWQIIEGCNEIPVCLIDIVDEADAGPIVLKGHITLHGHELNAEIRSLQATETLRICQDFLKFETPPYGVQQIGKPTYLARRTAEDSELATDKTIDDQFNLLRTVDNLRYPAFFRKNGIKYNIYVEKIHE